MAEIRTITTLRRKRDEVRKYERCLDQARADLTHLIAAIAIFEAKGGDESLPSYSDLRNFETLLDIGPDINPRAALGDKG
jgi:hypothetical protein